jgi:VanZ family protein
MNKKILRILLIIMIFFWMYIVFGFSNANGDASSSLSIRFAKIFSKKEDVLLILEQIIRKIAHLSEYACGGMLFYGLFLTFEMNPKKQIILASLLGIMYAVTDEIHQLFVPGRSGQFKDVCIDSIGVVLGVCILLFIVKIVKLIKDKLKEEKI